MPMARAGMPERIEVRLFLRRHLERVLAIEKACFAREAYPRELFLELYRDCGRWFFVARRAGRIAGYSVASAERAEAELVSIAVAPEHRRAGVATALLKRTLSCLRRARVRRVTLTVRPDNPQAIRFYRGAGFRPAGRIARYYEDRSDGLLMRLRLDD
jgi:[ribosomal protein S18]-alanine N-acetyltransferase